MIMLLNLWGHDPQSVESGRLGLEAARAFHPDVVILDVALPGLNGWELVRALRRELELQKILVIAATAYGRDQDRRRSREAGCDYHLVKPVDPDLLEGLLADWASGAPSTCPEELTAQLTDLTAAAGVVDALDHPELQGPHGWRLRDWSYELIPWGVRFRHQKTGKNVDAEIVAVIFGETQLGLVGHPSSFGR
jgi:CheY-like chemotaxis protein